MQSFLARIPDQHRKRFQERLNKSALDSLKVASVLLSVCFALEAMSQSDVVRRQYFWMPIALLVIHACLAVLVVFAGFVPKRVGLWQFCSGISPFLLTLMHLPKSTPEDVVGYMALELLGICIFIPYARIVAFSGVLIGTVIVLVFTMNPNNSSGDIIAILLPTFALSAFAFVARQRGIRFAFLREIEIESVNKELLLAKLALDQTSHFVMRLNENGDVEYTNDSLCSALLYSADELIGRKIYHLAPDWTADQWEAFVENLFVKRTDSFEIRLRTKRGDDILVEVDFDFMEFDCFDAQQNTVICAAGFDLSERRWMEEEIQRVQKLEGLGTLAGGVAHDYNNLLVPIVTNASIMLRDMEGDDPSRRYLEDILVASEHAANLTQQLLVYTGVGTMEAKAMSLAEEIRKIPNLIENSLPKGTQLTLSIPDDVPLVMAESAQIQRVLLNLVVNAGHAVKERGGHVSIRLGVEEFTEALASNLEPPMNRPAGEYVICEIEDNGHGMSSDVRRRMFDPFFTSKPNGRGLGLSAVLGIMRKHQGGVNVESTSGIGTTITIVLPAISTSEGVASTPPHSVGNVKAAENASEEASGKASVVVLVVDDEELIRKAAQQSLAASGYTVLLAKDGSEAIAACASSSPTVDIVLLDNRMPGPGMLSIVDAIQAQGKGIQIIASSGYASEVPTELMEGPRRLPFLAKPYGIEELLAIVESSRSRQAKATTAS